MVWLCVWLGGLGGGIIFLTANVFILIINRYEESTVEQRANDQFFLVGFCLIFLPLLTFMLYALKKELFTLTYYPVRLNRKTRRVHVRLLNEEVISVPWERVYWHIGRGGSGALALGSVRGHVMSEDGETVLKTFDMGHASAYPDSEQWLRRHWEFMRRYMEEGPQAVVGHLDMCLPIAKKKESFWFGLDMLLNMQLKGSPIFLLVLPLLLLASVVRWLVVKTQRLPVWPQWVEDECVIEPNDPYVREPGYVYQAGK
jgi:hypothetical protein